MRPVYVSRNSSEGMATIRVGTQSITITPAEAAFLAESVYNNLGYGDWLAPWWQPMATAPKDGGEVIILTVRHEQIVAAYEDGEWYISAGPEQTLRGEREPLRWMPLAECCEQCRNARRRVAHLLQQQRAAAIPE